MSFAKPLSFLFAFAIAPVLALAGEDSPLSGPSRLATFEDAGHHYFALSVQPDEHAQLPQSTGYDVAVLFDTSASQTGLARIEGLEVLNELVATLPLGSRISLHACDMDTILLSDGLLSPTDPKWEVAMARLKKRVPLGATDLGKAFRTVAKHLGESNSQRTIIYIGDGINRSHLLTSNEHRQLVGELVAAKITVSSLAIGPIVDVPNLASFANHTGGIVLSRAAIEDSTQAIGRSLGLSAAMPVVWIAQADLPSAFASHFPQQFPPLRLDRDTVLVGELNSNAAQPAKLILHGWVAGKQVDLAWNLTPEASHPDLGFLAAVLDSAKKDGGLSMPALGSAGLRAMSFMFADNANSMVKSGQFALKSGRVDSAIQIAEEALKQDPNNAEAQSLLRAAQKVAAEDASSVPTGKFMQTGNPFGDPAPGADPFGDPAPAPAPATDPFGSPVPAPTPATDPFGGSTPAPAANPAPATPVGPAPSSQPLIPENGLLDSLPASNDLLTGDLLAEEQGMREARAQAFAADVRSQIRDAYAKGRLDPSGVKNTLKLLLEEIDSTADISPALRSQLRDQVGSAVQVTAKLESDYDDRIQRAEAVRTQADAAQRLLAETYRREESLKQLVEQFNFMMEQQRYHEAHVDIAPEIAELAPDTVLENLTREESSLLANYAAVRRAFELREQGFVDVMRAVEEAAVPFAGDPPIVYPPPEVWQALSARRKERYGAINLGGGNDSEQKIFNALKQEIEVNYSGTPLSTIMKELSDDLGIPIVINENELNLIGVDPEAAITLELPPISLRSALRLILERTDPEPITYIIRNEVLEITSTDGAGSDPINKVYPVGDLVISPMALQMMGGGGMMGGMGGGMGGMGGGMGGMGGGMGGMGGGMGGMGGGMGGMGGGMGGMGGGMFAVPDDSSKKASLPATSPSSSVDPSEKWVQQLEIANDAERSQLESKIRNLVSEKVKLAEAHLEAKNQAAALAEFEDVIQLINGLLSGGYPQPWMYRALSLSMEACDYPPADIKRVLMSSLDFAGDTDKAFEIASYLAEKGLKQEALEMLEDIARAQPYRYDVFALALPLAEQTRDFDALRWVCVGALSKAWPKPHEHIFQKAQRLAKVTSLMLAQQGRVVESKSFDEEVKAALLRDIVVRVNWTGEADLDIRVKEPAGTICSLSNSQTISGGVLVDDASSTSDKASLDGYSEYYVCSQGYSGQYEILVQRVWGNVTGGRATVEVYTDFGTPDQAFYSKQVDLSEKAAVIQVNVKNGHRQVPIAEAHLAAVRDSQIATGRAVLGQLAGSSSSDSSAYDDYKAYRQGLAAGPGFGFGFPRGRGAVGYRPVITTLPEGMNLSVAGVVSADRRYVRIGTSPFFSAIGEVFTFNSATGQQGQNSGGQGGFGGGGGGVNGGGQGGQF